MKKPQHTFWTLFYRGTVIRGYHDQTLKQEVIKALLPDGRWIPCRSLRGARARISRHIGDKPKL